MTKPKPKPKPRPKTPFFNPLKPVGGPRNKKHPKATKPNPKNPAVKPTRPPKPPTVHRSNQGGANNPTIRNFINPPPAPHDVAPLPTSDNSYTPDSAYAQQVMDQLNQLQSSMSQGDFAKLMQSAGIPLVPAGDPQTGVMNQQVDPGTGQMAWPGSGSSGGTGTSSGGSTSGGGNTSGLNTAQQSAIAVMDAMLEQAGLSSLASTVLQLVQQGYTDPTVLSYMLQQTPEYQRRFIGNTQREKNGFAPLSPAEYLSTERAYQDVLRSSGLPAGFYDSPDDFANWISQDVSASEVQQRVNDALEFAQTTDPANRTALAAYYGIQTGDIAAYFLDSSRAMPLIQKQANAAVIGGAALDQGLQLTNLNDALHYADLGVTGQQAQQAYGTIAGLLPSEEMIAAQFGRDYSQQTAEQEFLGGSAAAQYTRRRLNNAEQALFGGKSGVGSSALSTSTTGAF